MRAVFIFQLLIVLFLWGCATTEPATVVQDADTMIFLEPGLRPETYLFPEYLFMEDFELDQHGRIPETTLVGIDLKTDLGLKTVLRRFNNLLASNGWKITKAEMAEQSFRLLAAMGDETLEIRAVQGTGGTQVFVLYQPSSEPR
jgi:hypothetical protein